MKEIWKRDPILFSFLLILIIFFPFYPHEVVHFYKFVHWNTIFFLSSLLIATTGLHVSKYFEFLALKIFSHFRKERSLFIFFVLFSLLTSPFLTNDISLFIIIPLILRMKNYFKMDIIKLLIFITISVNVGSSLTPIGNPQNIFLWHMWKIPFYKFILKLFPFVFFPSLILLAFIYLTVSSDSNLKIENLDLHGSFNLKLFLVSSSFLMFIVLFSSYIFFIFSIIFIFYFIFFRNVLLKVDWKIIVIFVLVFIDFHIISSISFVSNFFVNTIKNENVFISSLILSQIISNVPASVFISKFSHNWFLIAVGVNIGGNGTLISSFANLITLKFVEDKGFVVRFMRYSFVFLIFSAVISYLLLIL